ncbi:MAG: hypothetical protein IPJ05_01310 [Nitrosomonas sp.]|nr:hypothetical protein [Nitrosomonas sp.]
MICTKFAMLRKWQPVGAHNYGAKNAAWGSTEFSDAPKKGNFYLYIFHAHSLCKKQKFNDEGTVFGSISKSDFVDHLNSFKLELITEL